MKRINTLIVLFAQLIPARIPKIKQEDGTSVDGKEIPARVITMEFTRQTTGPITAENVGAALMVAFKDEQELRVLQGGKTSFHTSKPIDVTIKCIAADGTGHELSKSFRFTINQDRIETCMKNAAKTVAIVARVVNAPGLEATTQEALAYCRLQPVNVTLLEAPVQKEVAKVKKANKPAKVVELVESEAK